MVFFFVAHLASNENLGPGYRTMATRQRGNNDKTGGNAYNECVIRTDMVDSLENGACCCCVFLFLFLLLLFLLLLLLLLLPCGFTLLPVQLYSHRFVPDNMNKL